MLMTSFGLFCTALTVLPLLAWGSIRRNNSIIEQPTDVEHQNELPIPAGPTILSRHGREVKKEAVDSKRIFRRDKKKATFVSAEYADNINDLLQYLYHGRMGKRETEQKHRVLKCVQQPLDGITCFGNGKFYKFAGSLEGLSPVRISEMVRESEGVETNLALGERNADKGNVEDGIAGLGGFRLWKKRSADWINAQRFSAGSKPYQEVVMESHRLVTGPRSCYGFAAPNKMHKPKSRVSKCESRMCPCGGHEVSCGRRSRRRRLVDTKKAQTIWKRSLLRTVACRPLYIPTPKPSVNEGQR